MASPRMATRKAKLSQAADSVLRMVFTSTHYPTIAGLVDLGCMYFDLRNASRHNKAIVAFSA